MTTLNLDARQFPAGTFHFDLCGGVSVCALAIAMALCIRHGDFSAIPALLSLAAMALVIVGVTPPEIRSSPRVRGDGDQKTYFRVHLLRRHCLEQ